MQRQLQLVGNTHELLYLQTYFLLFDQKFFLFLLHSIQKYLLLHLSLQYLLLKVFHFLKSSTLQEDLFFLSFYQRSFSKYMISAKVEFFSKLLILVQPTVMLVGHQKKKLLKHDLKLLQLQDWLLHKFLHFQRATNCHR